MTDHWINLMGVSQVWLLGSPLPKPLHRIAIHTWFVISNKHNNLDRWEVWQRKLQAENRWGYVHQNLLPPFQGIIQTPFNRKHHWSPSLIAHWKEEEAENIVQLITHESPSYPLRHKYIAWPGPNSNTYTQWILNQMATNAVELPKQALGSRYPSNRIA